MLFIYHEVWESWLDQQMSYDFQDWVFDMCDDADVGAWCLGM